MSGSSRRQVPASVVVLLCLAGCGASESRGPDRPRDRTGPVPEAPGEMVAGAASPTGDPMPPEDVEPLGARFAAKELLIPRQAQPMTPARFTVDEGTRGGWMLRLGTQGLLTPAFHNGRVFLGGGFSSHEMYAVDAHTGDIRWRAPAPDGGPTAAIVEGGRVLYNTESCTLFANDAETGRELWKVWLGDPLMGQPAARNGRVFSGHIRNGGGYGFTALSIRDGSVIWTRGITADVLNAPVLDDRYVYFTTMDGNLWKVDQRTGEQEWRKEIHASSAPWLDGDRLLVAIREEDGSEVSERTVVLGKRNGRELSRLDAVAAPRVPARPDSGGVMAGWAHEGSRPTVVAGRMYQTIGNEVQCRDASTGRMLWRRRYTDDAQGRAASPPAIAGAQLVIGTENGELIGLDIDTGLTTWAYQIGEPIVAQPTIAEGWVYASTTRGTVVGIEVADSALDGWHMWGGNPEHSGPVATRRNIPVEAAPTQGVLRLGEDRHDGEAQAFVLEGTDVSAHVNGYVTRVRVEQTFRNPYERAVEAVYLFPLPDDSAVDAMELRAGERVVRGQIRRKIDAQRQYEDARRRGVLASILEQQRPNLFRQRVANIRPGDAIRIVIEYVQALPYEEGSYRLIFPTAAAPRAQSDEEPEERSASRVVVAPGDRRPDRVRFRADIDLGGTLRGVTSPSHRVTVSESRGRTTVSLPREGVAPDRDIELRLAVADDEPTVQVMSARPADGRAGFVSMMVHPRIDVPDGDITPRELVFLVDTSSSMLGRPLELAKAAVLRALDGLRAEDTFRIVQFSDAASELDRTPLPATRANVDRARRYIDELTALGTTDMISGVERALAPPGEAGRLRIVLLVTDGYIGNERDVFREVHERLGEARVFGFGVGSAVNRYLLTRVAEVGRGSVQVVGLGEDPAAAADAFQARIARPYLTDVEIDWGALEVHDVYPRRLPDLFADQPLVVHGRYDLGGSGQVTVRGRIAGRPFEQTVDVALTQPEPSRSQHTVRPPGRPHDLASLWARTRVRDLMTAMALQPNESYRNEVTDIGLAFGLLTEWTAFIAIDEGYRADGAAATQPPAPGAAPDQGTTVPVAPTGQPAVLDMPVATEAPPPMAAPTTVPMPSPSMPSPAGGESAYEFSDDSVEGDLVAPGYGGGAPSEVQERRRIARPPRVDAVCRPVQCSCPDGSTRMRACRPDGQLEPCQCGG